MGLWSGIRSLFTPRASTDVWGPSFLSLDSAGRRTAAGERVSSATALQVAAWFAGCRMIAEDLATIPLCVYRHGADDRATPERRHPILSLLNYRPNPEMSAVSFRETLLFHAVSVKGGYAEIERDGTGKPIALWPIHPSRVTEMREPSGALYYRVTADFQGGSGKRFQAIDLSPYEMLHLHGVSLDGTAGISVQHIASESLGIALAAQTLAGASFGNGHQVATVIKYPQVIDEKGKQSLREQWAKMYQGARKGGNMAIVDRGGDVLKLAMTAAEAQSIETRQFQIVEVARWLRIPPSKLLAQMVAQGWAGVEGEGLQYVKDCLRPWAVRFEAELDGKILDGDGELYLRHEFGALTRGDSKGRSEYYRTMIATGAMSPDEARVLEGMNPQGGALAKFYMQGAMMPIEKLGQEQSKPTPDSGKTLPGEPGRPPKEEAADALRPVFIAAADRVLRKEAMAVQRKAGKAGFADWAPGFYDEITDDLVAQMAPCATSLGCQLPAAPIRAWHDRSRDAALASNGTALHPDNTPEKLADAVIAACLEAMP